MNVMLKLFGIFSVVRVSLNLCKEYFNLAILEISFLLLTKKLNILLYRMPSYLIIRTSY